MDGAVRYAFNGDVSLAYQVVGDGPVDVLLVGGWVSNLDLQWDSPYVSKFLTGLAEGHRLIITDRRGNGLSERFQAGHVSPIERLTDDLVVVMDAAASERAVVLALHEGGLIGQLLAAAYPSRLLGLVLVESMAAVVRKPDLPWLPDAAVHEPSGIRSVWGQTHGPNDFVFPPPRMTG